MENSNKNNKPNWSIIGIGIVVVVVLIYFAYSAGQNSNNQTTNLPITDNTNEITAPAVQQTTPPPASNNNVVPQQKVVATNFELSENPNYLFSKTFDPYKVKLYGVAIGDSISKINPSSIKNSVEYKPGLIRLLNGDAYMSSNGIVIGFYISNPEVQQLFGIYTESDIFAKLGWPEKSDTGTPYYIGANRYSLNTYHYTSRAIQVMYSEAGPSSSISINIGGI